MLRHSRIARERGQSLVEFSLSITVFLMLLLSIFDVGRAIFMYNGVGEAARDIARRTSVYPYPGFATDNLGDSDQTKASVDSHQAMVPGMNPVAPGSPSFECVDINGDPSLSEPGKCGSSDYEDYVRVTVSADYQPVSLLAIVGPITISSSSTIAFPKAEM